MADDTAPSGAIAESVISAAENSAAKNSRVVFILTALGSFMASLDLRFASVTANHWVGSHDDDQSSVGCGDHDVASGVNPISIGRSVTSVPMNGSTRSNMNRNYAPSVAA